MKKQKKTIDITDKVKTFEDAWKLVIADIYPVPDYKDTILTKSEVAKRKLEVICEALNEGWKCDWKNHNQLKYYPYFWNKENNGWAFAGSYCCCSFANRPSGLFLKDANLSTYCGNQFKDLWIDWIEG